MSYDKPMGRLRGASPGSVTLERPVETTGPTAPPPRPDGFGAEPRASPEAPPGHGAELLGQLPPPGLGLASASAQAELGRALSALTPRTTDPALRAQLEATVRAHQVATRGLDLREARLSVKKDASRPEVMTGWVERGVSGPLTAPVARLKFVPSDKSVKPILLQPNDLEGIRSGARIRLELEPRSEEGASSYRVRADESAYASSFLARVEREAGRFQAVGLEPHAVYRRIPLLDSTAPELIGKLAVVQIERPLSSHRTGEVRELVGEPGSLPAKLLQVALGEGVNLGFSAAAMAQVKEIQDTPIEGKDLRHLPFVTIDNDDSWDLDQAMCIRRRADGGFDIHYAIADVDYFIPENSPLDREAKRRANTYYLPGGRSIPMLPRELSEGVISLLPNVPRRAFVVTTRLDAKGQVVGSSFERGVIESRAKLTYDGVQRFHDLAGPARAADAQAGKDFTETLELLESVGKLRLAQAEARGAHPSPEEGKSVSLGPDGEVRVGGRARNEVEKWNEQVSLLANEAVGRALREAGSPLLNRHQPPPGPERIEAFRIFVAALGRPCPPEQSISQYLRALDPADPLREIIEERSRGCHNPAEYSSSTHGHSALALEDYAHFTAPMRRYVDVVNARLLARLVEGESSRPAGSKLNEHFLESVSRQALEAKRRTRSIETRATLVLNAAYLSERLGQTLAGHIVAVRPSGVKVQLADGVRIDVPARMLRAPGDEPPVLEHGGTALQTSRGRFSVRDALELKVSAASPELETYELEVKPAGPGAGA